MGWEDRIYPFKHHKLFVMYKCLYGRCANIKERASIAKLRRTRKEYNEKGFFYYMKYPYEIVKDKEDNPIFIKVRLPLEDGIYKFIYDAPMYLKYINKKTKEKVKTLWLPPPGCMNMLEDRTNSYLASFNEELEIISPPEAYTRMYGMPPDYLDKKYHQKVLDTAIPWREKVIRKYSR